MDMKKILQTLDGAASKPVEGSNDMKKFLSVISEGKGSGNRLTTAEQMVYNAPAKKESKGESWIKPYIALVESEISKKKHLDERVLPGEETPPGINRLTGRPVEPAAEPAPAEKPVPLSSRYDPRFKNGPEPYTIEIDGKVYKFAGRDKQSPGAGEVIKVPAAVIGIRGLGAVNVELGSDGLYYAAPKNESVAEAKKKTLKNSNPCWDGYKPVGTKKKGGKTVPNCVPVNEGDEK